jgi:hypothetical protein
MLHLAQYILSNLNWKESHFLPSLLHRNALYWVGEKFSILLNNSKTFWSVHQDFQKFRTWFIKFILMPYSSTKYKINNNINNNKSFN